ncbi:hypothetical protein PFISCL1PPCAC_18721, partial [Pristionchus fissidentatus]
IEVNTIAVRYCKRRHKCTKMWLGLNARYQIMEAYFMSRAMQPVLFIVLFFKFVIICSSEIVLNCFPTANYAVGYNEIVYVSVGKMFSIFI